MRSGVVVHENEVVADGTIGGSDDGVEDFILISHFRERSVLEDMHVCFILHADAAPDHDGTTTVAIVLGDVVGSLYSKALVPPPLFFGGQSCCDKA